MLVIPKLEGFDHPEARVLTLEHRAKNSVLNGVFLPREHRSGHTFLLRIGTNPRFSIRDLTGPDAP
jgi:hypothetical protein